MTKTLISSACVGISLLLLSTEALADCRSLNDDARFIPQENGLKDKTTGLIWSRCLLGQSFEEDRCRATANKMPWLEAEAAAEAVARERGASWRLPKLEELETLLDRSCAASPFPELFPFDTQGDIWTASPGFPVHDVAAIVSLEKAEIWGVGKGVARYVWPEHVPTTRDQFDGR